MLTKELDQKIRDVKLAGRLIVTMFVEIFGMSASVLNEKIIDDTDIGKDVKLHLKMLSQLHRDIQNSTLSKNEKEHRAEAILTFEIKYLNDLEKLLKLAKDKKCDKDNQWSISFDALFLCITSYRDNIAELENYLQGL